MKKGITVLVIGCIYFNILAQNTYKVREDDPTLMYGGYNNWNLKDSINDGRYLIYSDLSDTLFFLREAFVKNGKKNGTESRYYFNTNKKYLEINWLDGKKNGKEIKYDDITNGKIEYFLSYKNDVLDGWCYIYVPGFYGKFKNGFIDSIGIYSFRGDSYLEYRYINGKELLYNSCDVNGNETVINGNGFIIDSSFSLFPSSSTTTTYYLNGVKDGKEIVKDGNGNLLYEYYYVNDKMIKQIAYSDNNKIYSKSEWAYPIETYTDTAIVSLDTWRNTITYNKIIYIDENVKSGQWEAFYSNGIKKFSGKYENGNREGIWNWYFENGKNRIIADYSKNTWKHFDNSGQLRSTFKNEYLSLLTDRNWFSKQSLDSDTLVLSSDNKESITTKYVFYDECKIDIISYLSCGKDINGSTQEYSLIGDTLLLKIRFNDKSVKKYRFKIISADEEEIKLQVIQ